ncbi:MAG: hypothetical protein IJH87_05380 [Atopobiaceae bacterium]|nr:hypothetical protein [Atopobiaceae bacterium]
MVIPDEVRILGLTYSVVEGDLNEGDGYILPRQQRIVLAKGLSEEMREQVFLHEVIHGVLDQLGYSSEYEDEKLVQGLTVGLHQALFVSGP